MITFKKNYTKVKFSVKAMDCGDGVTVHIFKSSDCEHDTGLKLSTVTLPEVSIQNPKDSHVDPGEVPRNVGENMEYITPTSNVQVTLLHPRSYEMLEEMQNSIHSVASSSNSSGDIGTLDTIDSNYSIKSTFKENVLANDVAVLSTPSTEHLVLILKSTVESPEQNSKIELENTTNELQKQQQTRPGTQLQHRESISCGIEESTEVLLVNSTECDDKYFGGGRAYSGTDSDVEVLMSEEIIESDWSAGCTATDDLAQTPDEPIGAVIAKESHIVLEMNEQCIQNSKTVNSALVKEESTDQEISVEDFSRSSNCASEQPGREELINIISEQATHIQRLESTIERFRLTHQTLFKHVEALRQALDLNGPDDQRANGVDNLLTQDVLDQQ